MASRSIFERLYHVAQRLRSKEKGPAVEGQLELSQYLDLEVVEEHIDAYPWDFVKLSRHRSMREWFVRKHVDRPWDFRELLAGSVLSEGFIREHWERMAPWREEQWKMIRYIPLEIIWEQLDARPWNWDDISSHPKLSLDKIRSRPDKPWNFEKWSSFSEMMTLDDVEQVLDKQLSWINVGAKFPLTPRLMALVNRFPEKQWPWSHFLRCPSITIEFIERHIDRWNWLDVCSCAYITPAFIEAHLGDRQWTCVYLSRNPCLTSEFIRRHMDLPWWLPYLIEHPWMDDVLLGELLDRGHFHVEIGRVVGMELLEAHLDKPWSWVRLSAMNPHITVAFIQAHKEWPWDWKSLSENPCIPFEDIVETMGELPWSYKGLSMHPGLTEAFVLEHLQAPWDWSHLVQHPNMPLDLWKTPGVEIDVSYVLYHPRITCSYMEKNVAVLEPWLVEWSALFEWLPDITLDFVETWLDAFVLIDTETYLFHKVVEMMTYKYRVDEEILEARQQQGLYFKQEVKRELIEVACHPDNLARILDDETKLRWNMVVV